MRWKRHNGGGKISNDEYVGRGVAMADDLAWWY